MRAALRDLLFTEDKLYPPRLGNLAAWYDSLDPVTLLAVNGQQVTDGGTVCLWKDKSGNSAVNALVLPGVAGNCASFTALTAFGTGDFSVSTKVRAASFSGNPRVFGAAVNGFELALVSTGTIRSSKNSVGNNAESSGIISVFEDVVVGYTRSGTTGTYYINGVPSGTITDSFDYSVGISAVGAAASGASTLLNGNLKWSRVYSTALDATAMAADAAGTVQANCTFNCNFTTAPTKLANGDTFVCTTGQTVTLNSSGATGARIAGERDLFQGTAANRPVYLAYSGTKYGYLNGTAGNYFSTPDSAALSFSTAIGITAKINATDYTPSSPMVIAAKEDSTSTRSYRFSINTSGNLTLMLSPDGSSAASVATSSAALAFSDGTIGYVAVDWRASDGRVRFFTSSDGVTWSQLGTDQSIIIASIADTASVVEIGRRVAGTEPFNGKIYYVQFSDAFQGTVVGYFNPALYTSGTTFTASTGEVWTVNGGAHIVTRTGLYGDGVNDYLKTAAFSLSQPESVYLVGDQVTWTDAEFIYDGNADATMGLRQSTPSPQVNSYAGNFTGQLDGWTLKTDKLITAVFNGTSSSLRVNRGTAVTGNAGASNAGGLIVGARASLATFSNIFVSEVAIYSAAHGTATQDRWALYAGRKWGFSV
jgi:hypothetical protein